VYGFNKSASRWFLSMIAVDVAVILLVTQLFLAGVLTQRFLLLPFPALLIANFAMLRVVQRKQRQEPPPQDELVKTMRRGARSASTLACLYFAGAAFALLKLLTGHRGVEYVVGFCVTVLLGTSSVYSARRLRKAADGVRREPSR
jgi:hypothetical protein